MGSVLESTRAGSLGTGKRVVLNLTMDLLYHEAQVRLCDCPILYPTLTYSGRAWIHTASSWILHPGTLSPTPPVRRPPTLSLVCAGSRCAAALSTTATTHPRLTPRVQVASLCGVHALNTLLQVRRALQPSPSAGPSATFLSPVVGTTLTLSKGAGSGGVAYEQRLAPKNCLSSTAQGPYFSEIELASIAQDLDAKERELMAESGADGADYLKYMAEGECSPVPSATHLWALSIVQGPFSVPNPEDDLP